MSAAAVVPPPNSSSLVRRRPRLTEQARALLTTLNLHYAGVAALVVLNLYLAANLVYTVQQLHANNDEALQQQRNELRGAEIAAVPLRGIDVKVVNSTADADQFYAQRLPYAYSQVLAELGVLTRHNSVRLTRVQYAQTPSLSGAGELIEVRMDASLSGDYRPLVQFMNSLERDKMFFIINGITFTGTQGGQVNLRMRLTTYLRQPTAAESNAELPPAEPAAPPTAGGPQ